MLALGSKGDDVRALQAFLNAQGCRDATGQPLVVDGSLGTRTDQALRIFQAREGLQPDGIFGPKTEAIARSLAFGNTTRIEGVDVSVYQTANGKSLVDWTKLDPQPAFFWVRASVGLSADSGYSTHVAGGSAIGAVPGAYHFFVAADDSSVQAKLWRATAGEQPDGQTLRPALDIENNRVDANKNPVPLTDAEARIWATNARALITAAEDLFDRDLVVYTNPKTAYEMRNYLDKAFWGARLLWLAEYTSSRPTIPRPWTSCAAHQFAGDVKMPGASCLMDRDVIYDAAMFAALKS